MRVSDAYLFLFSSINNVYQKREAENISAIVLQDIFGINNILRQDDVPAISEAVINEIAERLKNKEPVQYITGKSFFYESEFKVTPDVLIPRPETEELVFQIIKENKNKKISILDIGTGSGCIPISLKKKLSDAKIYASDVSEAALKIAQENAVANNCKIDFYLNDILNKKTWTDLPTVDIIVSNPPYIPLEEKDKMPGHVLEWEPHLALFSEKDPLLFYGAIADFAKTKLNGNGKIYFEINEFHAKETRILLEGKEFNKVKILKDLEGKDRMIIVEP